MRVAQVQSRPPSASEAPPQAVLRNFHPGWFGAVMGTGIVAVAAAMNPGGIAGMRPILMVFAVVMLALAWILAVVLIIPYLLRWVHHPDSAWRDMRHPVIGALYATFPAGLLVLATTTAAVGPTILPVRTVLVVVGILAVVGSVLALAASVSFAVILFVASSVSAEAANGGWFIPPVVTIIVPLALLPLIPAVDAATARLLLVVGYAAWGIGFFLFVLIAALLYARHVYHALPEPPLAPSLWIGLGPIGVGSLALVRLAPFAATVWNPTAASVMVAGSALAAAVLWGFGLWWLATAILLLGRYRRTGPLPYGVGWWAFTFPLGAYTVATLALASAWNVATLGVLGAVLFVGLVGFWLVVTANTLRHIRTGGVWRR